MANPETPLEQVLYRLLPKSVARRVDHSRKARRADATVVSFPKCGRTWLRVLLTSYFKRRYGLKSDAVLEFANLHRLDRRIPKIHFTHDDSYKARPDALRTDKSHYATRKVIHLVRDPRDVIVSLYFHRKHRDGDVDGSLEDFVFGAEGGLDTVIAFYNIWARQAERLPRLTWVRYEDLQHRPEATLGGVLRALGPAPDPAPDPAAVRAAIAESDFARMRAAEQAGRFPTGRLRPKDPSDGNSYKVRRGKVGGYADYFDRAARARIDERVAERLSPLYGYSVPPAGVAVLRGGTYSAG